ncbi:hypothetical protein V5799_000920 [Amblyomma americanum]|uniref:Uncharacterized protein n=1 Tax=Amblyomma americanum TaxID=6943 RepID=A0AAQ4D1M6_AMBAM
MNSADENEGSGRKGAYTSFFKRKRCVPIRAQPGCSAWVPPFTADFRQLQPPSCSHLQTSSSFHLTSCHNLLYFYSLESTSIVAASDTFRLKTRILSHFFRVAGLRVGCVESTWPPFLSNPIHSRSAPLPVVSAFYAA